MSSHRIAPALVVAWLIVASAGAEEAPGDLDTLVAPIALYPDALVADVLPASAYPVQVVEAARALGNGGHVDPSQASQWDPSVQALIDFPSVLAMLNDRLEWTTQLGQAVAEDQGAVLAAVQRVRAEAEQAGNLQSNDKQTVVDQGDDLVIEPTDPGVIYVPQYDPVAILSTAPPWGYYPPAYGVLGFGDGFAIDPLDAYGIGWGPGFFGGQIIVIDDHHRHRGDDHAHDHGHSDGYVGHGGGHAWRPPPRESVGHFGGMPGGVRGGGLGGGRGLGDHAAGGGIPHRGMVGTAPPHVVGGFPAPVAPAHGGAFDHVGGGGWNARSYSARGAHSFGDGFGGGGWSHSGVGGMRGGGLAGGFHGGGSGGGGHGGGYGGGAHR